MAWIFKTIRVLKMINRLLIKRRHWIKLLPKFGCRYSRSWLSRNIIIFNHLWVMSILLFLQILLNNSFSVVELLLPGHIFIYKRMPFVLGLFLNNILRIWSCLSRLLNWLFSWLFDVLFSLPLHCIFVPIIKHLFFMWTYHLLPRQLSRLISLNLCLLPNALILTFSGNLL